MFFKAFYTLHVMYHEATACHVTADMVDLLAIVQDLLKTACTNRESLELRQWLAAWKDQPDIMRKLLTLLNSFTPPDLRQICIGNGNFYVCKMYYRIVTISFLDLKLWFILYPVNIYFHENGI